MDILKIEHLSKTYGKGETAVKALDDVSFSVQKGQFVAIIGPSGSGKSTILHMLGGVDRPTSGKVFVDNTDIYSLNETQLAIFRRRQIGLIYQFYNLIPVLTVEENIKLPMLLDEHKVDKKQFSDLVKILNLQERLNHLPNQLSGGQQQRVAIARALVNEPVMILADEATGNLDTRTSYEIMALLQELNQQQGKTIVFVTHEPDIAAFSSRTVTLRDGKVQKDLKNDNVRSAKEALASLPVSDDY